MTQPAAAFEQDVIALIQAEKQQAAVAVNAELRLLYWSAGQRIYEEILGRSRADYGKHVIAKLAERLTTQFSNGWSKVQLSYCVIFSEVFLISRLSTQCVDN
ncbi:DUF1016 N-terminal domain-containing protein [Photobacterium halotolerans]|uniref:YhcG N-terminal domain-containing protein n=1 Tax=Photobacterium halotolerans TaxID=265726 RepID=A0A0F5VJD8_9GAMM|nr:DUF1016 N-terminal domain-containing protein [Photobacterium halotolerans]KKD01590.1 hypothetical protein KY46_01895 [Photobacterium halotolerans]